MRNFSGRGGRIYELGEVFRFEDVPLEDCGEGWDWRAPEGLRYWLEDGLSFQVWNGEWTEIGAVEIHHRSGRVGFPRCLSGKSVRASGSCHTMSLLSEGEAWELEVDVFINQATTFGAESVETRAKVGDARARIRGIPEAPIESVLAWLPVAPQGAFVGRGTARGLSGDLAVDFNQEGVRYVLR